MDQVRQYRCSSGLPRLWQAAHWSCGAPGQTGCTSANMERRLDSVIMRRRQSKMLAEERRRAILQLVKRQGSAAVEDLVKQFNVSAVTLRADLGQLAKEGALVRSYGGATAHEENGDDYPLTVKNT